MMVESLEMMQSGIELVYVVKFQYLQDLDLQTSSLIHRVNLQIQQHLLLILQTVQRDLIH